MDEGSSAELPSRGDALAYAEARYSELRGYADGGLLDSTWAAYGGKPSDPAEQIRISKQYARDRYGKPPTEQEDVD